MSTPRYAYLEPFIVTEYGTALKTVAEFIVNNDPCLEFDSITTETASKYDAYIRVTGSNVGFRIVNSASNLSIYKGIWDSSGTWGNETSTSGKFSVNYNIHACCYGFGNAYGAVQIQSGTGSGSVMGFAYGRFTCQGSDDLQVPVYMVSTSVTYPNFFESFFVPNNIYDEDIGDWQDISYTNISDITSVSKAGYLYSWQPIWNGAYTNAKGFVNIKWDGSYSLYRLASSSGYLTVYPGKECIVDGVTYKSIGALIKTV